MALWGGSVLQSIWLCGRLVVALGWLCTPESVPSLCLVYGFLVALGGQSVADRLPSKRFWGRFVMASGGFGVPPVGWVWPLAIISAFSRAGLCPAFTLVFCLLHSASGVIRTG